MKEQPSIEAADIALWCDETLPAIYNPGLFDDEETTDEVWASVTTAINSIADCPDTVELLMDAAADWFRQQRDLELDALFPLPEESITTFLTGPQTMQHSADWYAERRNRLTASEFSHILTGSRERLLKTKLETGPPHVFSQNTVALAQLDGEMVATSWGHRFEPVVRDIYEHETAGVKNVCDTLGRFTHRDYAWLSASPDGIVVSGPLAGRLLEIKAPKTRQPDTYVPFEYYVQMQVQMEVCDLEAVDFVEAQFRQALVYSIHGCPEPFPETEITAARWKGCIAVYGHLEEPSTWVYSYGPPAEKLEDCLPAAVVPNLPLLDSSVWWLAENGWFPRTVLRNPTWWQEKGQPAAELFWAEVQSRREIATASTDSEEVIQWLGSTN